MTHAVLMLSKLCSSHDIGSQCTFIREILNFKTRELILQSLSLDIVFGRMPAVKLLTDAV